MPGAAGTIVSGITTAPRSWACTAHRSSVADDTRGFLRRPAPPVRHFPCARCRANAGLQLQQPQPSRGRVPRRRRHLSRVSVGKGRYATIDVPEPPGHRSPASMTRRDRGHLIVQPLPGHSTSTASCWQASLPHIRCPRPSAHHSHCHEQPGEIVGTTSAGPGTFPTASCSARAWRDSLHPYRLPGRPRNQRHRHNDRGQIFGISINADAAPSGEPHADADDDDVGPLTAGPEVPAQGRSAA